jgi:membrane-associated protease RseP (regulator of RpoE activity)
MVTFMLKRCTSVVAVSMALGTVLCGQGRAQETRLKQDADLTIDGRVTSVFQNGEQYLLQILVQRSEVPSVSVTGGTRYPAPGEYAYVHVAAQAPGIGRISGRASDIAIPQPQTRIRAFLSIGEAGQWNAVGKDWYEEDPAQIGDRFGRDTRNPSADEPLGIASERVTMGREAALKVTRVVPDSPAAKAGIEPGDILVKANDTALTSQDRLTAAVRENRGQLAITVRDVRTGRDVRVEVKSESYPPIPGASANNMKPLGVKTELAFYGGEAVLKVTSVDPDSPAQRAGIEVGLLILQANGKPVAKPEQLTEAERQSRGRLELKVVDPTDRREQVIQIAL